MISWYIQTDRIEDNYLNKVNEVVKPCMDHFCERLCETKFTIIDREFIFNEMLKIVEELPFLAFSTNDNDFWIKYNSHTSIRFNDELKPIIRDIKLKKVLEEVDNVLIRDAKLSKILV